MLTLLRNAELFAPARQGRKDILVAGRSISKVADTLPELAPELGATVDLRGARVIPGLIDAHVHLTGGGGESGPASRVPPVPMSMLSRAGVTTAIGVLGTDGTTRSVEALVAATLGLREEGLSAWCWTGSYEVPPITISGSVRSDIVFIDPIIGVGELAISDHRSSQPTFDEFVRIAADCHVAGMMSGKAGVLHLHLGDGPRGLDLVRRAIGETELPPSTFYPTHVNRKTRLFQEALDVAARGVIVDVTAFPVEDGEDVLGSRRDREVPRRRRAARSADLQLRRRRLFADVRSGRPPREDGHRPPKRVRGDARRATFSGSAARDGAPDVHQQRRCRAASKNERHALRFGGRRSRRPFGGESNPRRDGERAFRRSFRRANHGRDVRSEIMSPAKVEVDKKRGFIVPIGGAEDKEGTSTILRRFVDVAGGNGSRIIIIPTASKLEETGRRYEKLFRKLGADESKALPLLSRDDTDKREWLDYIENASGIFVTGGNQLRLTTILGGTPVAKAIRRANARGVAVGGTSAGAAILSEHMIAFGAEGHTPHAGAVTLVPGFGLTNRVIIDQHFRQRDRLGRLLTALAYNPFAVGVGLDEDTAAFIDPNRKLTVYGAGALTIVDASELDHSSIAEAREGNPVCLTNVRLHVLTAGGTFDLETRKASAPAD